MMKSTNLNYIGVRVGGDRSVLNPSETTAVPGIAHSIGWTDTNWTPHGVS